jgi:ADP-ribose pyrophosphatase
VSVSDFAATDTSSWRHLGEKSHYQGSIVSVATQTVQSPNGAILEREVVHHTGAVAIVPLSGDSQDTVLLFSQYRSPVKRQLLEIPAGKLDIEGEDITELADRELQEETGTKAGYLEKIAEFYTSPGFCDEKIHLFVARELTPVEPRPEGEEELLATVVTVKLDLALQLISQGYIVDAKTIIGLLIVAEKVYNG